MPSITFSLDLSAVRQRYPALQTSPYAQDIAFERPHITRMQPFLAVDGTCRTAFVAEVSRHHMVAPDEDFARNLRCVGRSYPYLHAADDASAGARCELFRCRVAYQGTAFGHAVPYGEREPDA